MVVLLQLNSTAEQNGHLQLLFKCIPHCFIGNSANYTSHMLHIYSRPAVAARSPHSIHITAAPLLVKWRQEVRFPTVSSLELSKLRSENIWHWMSSSLLNLIDILDSIKRWLPRFYCLLRTIPRTVSAKGDVVRAQCSHKVKCRLPVLHVVSNINIWSSPNMG